MRQIIGALSILLLMSLYQNMDLVSADFVSLHGLNEDVRAAHAKELLGYDYFESEAQHARDLPLLNQNILNEFRQRLPKAYKDKAMDLTNTLIEESAREGIDPVLILAVISTESSFRPWIKGTSGELGLMQILPATAEWVANKTGYKYRGKLNLRNPKTNIILGVRYVAMLRKSFKGQGFNYLAAYNMGSRNVRKLIAQNISPRIYPDKVLRNYKNLYSSLVYSETQIKGWEVAGR